MGVDLGLGQPRVPPANVAAAYQALSAPVAGQNLFIAEGRTTPAGVVQLAQLSTPNPGNSAGSELAGLIQKMKSPNKPLAVEAFKSVAALGTNAASAGQTVIDYWLKSPDGEKRLRGGRNFAKVVGDDTAAEVASKGFLGNLKWATKELGDPSVPLSAQADRYYALAYAGEKGVAKLIGFLPDATGNSKAPASHLGNIMWCLEEASKQGSNITGAELGVRLAVSIDGNLRPIGDKLLTIINAQKAIFEKKPTSR